MSPKPPKLLRALVRKMFPAHRWEEIEGDLSEDFEYNLQQHGTFRAKTYYLLDVLRLVKLYFILKKRTQSNNTVMNKFFSIHLKYGLRSLYRQKGYQALNLATLTLSFSCFMLIFLFVYNQQHKDNFLTDKEQIMRLDYVTQGAERTKVHMGMPAVLQEEFPEIAHYARIKSTKIGLSTEGSLETFSETMTTTDPGFMAVFQQELVLGGLPKVKESEIMISEKVASKLYGSLEVVGKSMAITIDGSKKDYVISGVLKDLPRNASFSADLVSFITATEKHSLSSNYWRSNATYFMLAPETNTEALCSKIPELMAKHTNSESLTQSKYLFRSFDEIKNSPDIGDGFLESVDGQAIFIFTLVGIVILFLGIANYINLLAALSLRKTQDVSIKKVMGASSRSLISQQLIESAILCLVAVLLSGILVIYLTPKLENFLNSSLKFTNGVLGWVCLLMVSIPLLLTVFAAIYPALLMSKVRFTEMLKSKMSHSPRSRFIRNGLLTLQFTISTFLIIGTLTFVKQLGFIRALHKTDEIGKVLILKGELGKEHKLIKEGLKALPEVDLFSISSMVPGPDDNGGAGLANEDFERQFDLWIIDENFLDVMGLEMAAGENFYGDNRSEKTDVLINEALLNIATKDSVLGKEVYSFTKKGKVVGIVKDFSIQSAREKVGPGMFMQPAILDDFSMFANLLNKVAIRLNTSDYESAIAKIETVWKATYPDKPFDIEFMDDRMERIYTSEMRMGQLFGTFTTVAIIISCLGILGLLTYLIEVRMKELGIRKVLGASFISQVKILTSNLWKVMLIANLIAFPLSYYFLKDWLESFAHRTNISSGLFIATAGIFAAIVALSALWQVLKLNRLNPTEVLRNE